MTAAISSVSSSIQTGDRFTLTRPGAGSISVETGVGKTVSEPSQNSKQGSQSNNATRVPETGKAQTSGSQGQGGESDSIQLSNEEQVEVQTLQSTDREVRAHEQAHVASAGSLATSGPSYSYKTGPDGKRYAVAGEVGIDSSPVRDNPQATIAKAERVQRAALAPADPSAQDRRVAADAAKMASEARMEIARQQYQQKSGEKTDVSFTTRVTQA